MNAFLLRNKPMSRECPGYCGLVHGTDNAVHFQISLRLVDERGGGIYKLLLTKHYLPLNRNILPARSARHTSSSVRSIRTKPSSCRRWTGSNGPSRCRLDRAPLLSRAQRMLLDLVSSPGYSHHNCARAPVPDSLHPLFELAFPSFAG